MSLAQVVYRISKDSDFAARWRHDPQSVLDNEGLRLSCEEIAFLSRGLKKAGHDERQSVSLVDLLKAASYWRG